MTSQISFTAVYEPVENGWTQACIKELPGVITAAPTLDEAKEWLVDALREYLLALQESGPGPSPNGSAEHSAAEHGSLEIVISAA